MGPRSEKKRDTTALGEYERKRDFGVTGEPAPKTRRRKRKGGPRFVVQEHSARRLHWDLRLEHDGVAASWAIPNGIPTDPNENRKAVHTEDHPLEYLEFEGEIPAGEYGAGTMRVWDRGSYEVEKWESGKIVIGFAGERLSGRYALFRAGKGEKDWMIHRIDPPIEVRDPFPQSVLPMAAKLAPLPAREEGWAAEVKWDGVRAIAYCRPGRIELQTRNLNVVTAQYPEVRRLTRQLGTRDAVLDGELVAFDERGRPSFERLQQRIHQTDASVVRRRMKSHPVTYVLFDLLYLEGRDLMGEPYSRRRELLEGLELDGESWQTPGYSAGHARELLAASAERQLEGIVLKRLDSRYTPGKRSGAWLKVKTVGRQEFVIGGPDVGATELAAAMSEPALAEALAARRKRVRVRVGDQELSLSDLDKVLYPATGFSKGELIEWYARMAEVLLPHLRDRPLTLNKEIDYCLVEDLPTLVWAANLADVELHTSLSLASAMERPTAVVFDLDPGAPADVLDCAQVALWIRGMFEQLGLNSYPKTSGSKGIQIYAPLNTDVSYERTKPFAKAVAETLEAKFGDRVVSRTTKAKRAGKVLVDWSQNDRHKTTVCVYSLRARERPTVSTPLEWDELESACAARDPDRLVFDHADVLRRIEDSGDLFAPVLSEKQQLPR